MRRLLLCLVVAGLAAPALAAPAQPDSVEARFDAGTEAYREGRYGQSIDAYRSILESGRGSAEVYYNLGNAYYRAGEMGRAIQFYEKARTLRPGDARVRHNLEQARDRVPSARTQNAPPSARLQALVRDTFDPLPLFVFTLLLLSAAGAVAVVRDAPDADRPGWRNSLAIGLVAGGFLLGGAAIGTSYLETTTSRAVVIADRVALRSAPSGTSAADTTLPEGVLLRVLPTPRAADTSAAGASATGAWNYVRLPDGRRGWLPTSALGRVEE
jgi:hypothetical protein